MLIFVLFALIGIALEIWGFIWLLRYNRLQKASELVSWALKHGYSENWASEIPREKYMVMNNDIDYERNGMFQKNTMIIVKIEENGLSD